MNKDDTFGRGFLMNFPICDDATHLLSCYP